MAGLKSLQPPKPTQGTGLLRVLHWCDMALVPFSYANPFTDQLRLKERLFTINGHLLRIEQAWKEGGKGGTDIGFGASVYPAAYVLAEYLERHPHLVRGKRVIELGTGTGFLGIAAGVLGASRVCLTDGDDESLRLTRSNVEANLPTRTVLEGNEERNWDRPRHHHHQQHHNSHTAAAEDSREESCSSHLTEMTVRKLRWGCAADIATTLRDGMNDSDGNISSTLNACGWDVVLGSDIAAFPYASSFGDLLRTIVGLVFVGDRRVVPGTTTAKIPTPENRYPGVEEEGGCGRGRRVLVLIAHKRRHVSEDAFFETLESELGEECSRLPTQADDVHADFRGEGITIHKYQIDLLPH